MIKKHNCLHEHVGGVVASWLVRLVQLWALAGDIVLFSWAGHFTLTVPLATQVYKWVLANLMLGVTLRGLALHPEGSRSTPSCFMLQKLG